MASILRGLDALAKPTFHYMGIKKTQTLTGGCITISVIIATLFYFGFSIHEFFTNSKLVFNSYTKIPAKSVLDKKILVTAFLPAISLRMSPNYYVKWQSFNRTTSIRKDVESINCETLIDSWTEMSEDERADFKDKFDGYLDYYVCPNITDLYLSTELEAFNFRAILKQL